MAKNVGTKMHLTRKFGGSSSKEMRFEIYTNIPEIEIRKIIKFVKPPGLITSNFDVKITNSRHGHCGVFYEKGGFSKKCKAMGTEGRPLIIVRITKSENEYPYFTEYLRKRIVKFYWDKYNEKKEKWETWYKFRNILSYSIKKTNKHLYTWRITKLRDTRGYIDNLVLSREEALVHVLAHEFRHFWQCNHRGKRGKIWNARGKFSERDADAYAIKKARVWRALHNPKDVIQIRKLDWDLIEKGVVIANNAAGVSTQSVQPLTRRFR